MYKLVWYVYDINKNHAHECFLIEVKQECSWEVAAGKFLWLKMSLHIYHQLKLLLKRMTLGNLKVLLHIEPIWLIDRPA